MDSTTLNKLPKSIEKYIYTFLGETSNSNKSIKQMRNDVAINQVNDYIKSLKEFLTDIKTSYEYMTNSHEHELGNQYATFRKEKLDLIQTSKMDTFKEKQIYYFELEGIQHYNDKMIDEINKKFNDPILRIKNDMLKTEKKIKNGYDVISYLKTNFNKQ